MCILRVLCALCVLYYICNEAQRNIRARFGSRKPQYFNTDRSKAVLLLRFLIVTCFCCSFLCFGLPIMWVTYFS